MLIYTFQIFNIKMKIFILLLYGESKYRGEKIKEKKVGEDSRR
jgi:hypothetical protein